MTLCEAAPVVGGKLGRHRRDHRLGTFTFDTGPTLLTLPQVFDDLFAATGAPLADVLPPAPARHHRPLPLRRRHAGRHRQRPGPAAGLAFDAALGAGTGAAWQRVVDRGAAIWRAVEEPIFGSTLSTRTLLSLGRRLARLDDLRAVAPHRTLRSVARELLPDPRQQLMLERYATYEGSDPRHAPGGAGRRALPRAPLRRLVRRRRAAPAGRRRWPTGSPTSAASCGSAPASRASARPPAG